MQKYQKTDYETIKYEIARLDRLIIFSLVQRFRYQNLVQRIKRDNNYSISVKDFKLMLEQRKSWAISAGLNPRFVDKLSQYLINYYLTEEKCR